MKSLPLAVRPLLSVLLVIGLILAGVSASAIPASATTRMSTGTWHPHQHRVARPRARRVAKPQRVRLSAAAVKTYRDGDERRVLGKRRAPLTVHVHVVHAAKRSIRPALSTAAAPVMRAAVSIRGAATSATPVPPFTQCPAVGLDTSCEILIDYTGSQTKILADGSQGPFDGGDDTLVGIVNDSSQSLGSISLSSGTDIFGFDSDGICSGYSPAPAGCPFGPTGYEGPNTSFSGINASATGGSVNFTTPVAPGSTAYFSLEEALDATTVFSGGPSTSEQGGATPSFEKSTTCYAKLPVNCATGAFIHQFSDLSVADRGVPLAVRRTYSSTNDATTGPLGYGWSFSYGASLSIDGSSGDATYTDGSGAAVDFVSDGSGGFRAPPWVQASLASNGDGTYTMALDQLKQRLTFSSTGRLTSEADLNGETTTLAYDSAGDLQTVTDEAGHALSVTWSGSHISQVTDPIGRTETYGYDSAGDLTSATDALGKAWHFTYDSSHLLLTMVDARGGTTTNTYDSSGRTVAQVDPAGLRTTWSYVGDPASGMGSTTTMTDEHGNVTTYSYADLELRAVTHGAGTSAAATTSYTYDPSTLGQATVTDPLGRVTSNSFDRQGDRTASTDPMGRTTSWSYDSYGDVTSLTTPSGATTAFQFDGSGNLNSATDPLGFVTTYAHGDSSHPGDVTSRTDPDGRVVTLTFDGAGNVATQATSPSSGVTRTASFGYDPDGERVCAAAPTAVDRGVSCPADGSAPAGTTKSTYDSDGRVTSVVDPLGDTTRNTYDANGDVVSTTDPRGTVTGTTYDADGRPTAVTTASSTTATAYDLTPGAAHCASLPPQVIFCTTTTDPNGHVTTTGWDSRGQSVVVVRPGGATATATYDLAGNTTSSTAPSGTVTSSTYDADNELTGRSYSGGGTPAVTYSYDVDGNRIGMTDGTGSSTSTYDADERLTGRTTGAGATTTYAYDGAGDVTTIGYDASRSVARAFDGAGELATVTDWGSRTTTFSYDADGDLVSTAYPNGDRVADTYDNADRQTGSTLARSSTTLAALRYTRDANGNVSNEADSGALSASKALTYDSRNQLTASGTEQFAYDTAGNPTTFSGTAQTFNAADQLTSTGAGSTSRNLTYDADGQRTALTGAGGFTTYGYDAAGDLTTSTTTSAPVAPTVSTVSPASGPSAGGNTVTISGTGFTAGTTVQFGFTAAAQVSVTSGTVLTATAPAGTGTVDVTVTTADGTSSVSAGDQYTYTAPAPVVTSIAPTHGPATGGTAVTVSGTGLSGATAVRFGNTAATITSASSTALTAVAPTGAGTVDVTVTTPAGTSGTGATDRFTYDTTSTPTPPPSSAPPSPAPPSSSPPPAPPSPAPPSSSPPPAQDPVPVLSSVAPSAGPLRGGTAVVLHGSGLGRVTAVRFGTHRASFVVRSSSTITAKTPPGHGRVTVTVSTQHRTSTISRGDYFTYTLPPSLHRLSPSSAPERAKVKVTLRGSNLSGVASVHFGSTSAQIVKRTSGTLVVRVSRSAGRVTVTATNVGGTSAHTAAMRFTFRSKRSAGFHRGMARAIDLATTLAASGTTTTTTTTTYAYDGDGLRASLTSNGTTTPFTYDLTTAVPTLLSDGTTSYVYGPNGLPIEQVNGSSVAYYFHDQIGSTRALVGTDGAIAATENYTAYGVATTSGSVSSPLTFAGGYQDATDGLLYLINRYYDPTVGQFISIDPLFPVTGAAYRYAAGDPINVVDLTGLSWYNPFSWSTHTWETVGTVAAVVGVAAGAVALCAATACIGDVAVAAGATTLTGTLAFAATTSEVAEAAGSAALIVGSVADTALTVQACRKGLSTGCATKAVGLGIDAVTAGIGRYIPWDSIAKPAWGAATSAASLAWGQLHGEKGEGASAPAGNLTAC